MWKQNTVFAMLVLLAACGSIPDRNAVPPDLGEDAVIPGIPLARYWGDEPKNSARLIHAMSREEILETFPGIVDRPHDYLAVSGGGANGAFGAGLLNGWTEAGTRPEFAIVTGISTGALIAPFAFLGSEYDGVLKKFYTTTKTEDVLEKRRYLRGLTSDAMADSAPLKKLLAELIDEELLDKIAKEHLRGRRLMVGTVNLDAMRPVVWNMGEIAVSDSPRRLELFRSVLLASASIPGAFPPVIIPVKAGGKMYDEIHVDGGVCAQVFLLPVGLDWDLIREKFAVQGDPRIWVIRNSILAPKWESLELGLMTLVGRSISSLIHTQGLGDIYRIWFDARENGMDFNVAFMPADFDMEMKEAFDPEYMSALFDEGFRLAKDGYPWMKSPPGEEENTEPLKEE